MAAAVSCGAEETAGDLGNIGSLKLHSTPVGRMGVLRSTPTI